MVVNGIGAMVGSVIASGAIHAKLAVSYGNAIDRVEG